MKKVLYGIGCIDSRDFFRQTIVIDFLISQKCQILFFSNSKNLKLLAPYSENSLVKIIEVNSPFFIANSEGIDFFKSEKNNNQFNSLLNLRAFSQAQEWLGKPDFVIGDSEPTCAQYGYAYGCPVVTIDQKSKIFTRSIPKEINGYNCDYDNMCLSMFFPIAKRLAYSFFKLRENNNVTIIPPIYRKIIQDIVRSPQNNQFLIYISDPSEFKQSLKDIITIVKNREEEFHIFTKEIISYDFFKEIQNEHNIFIHDYENNDFENFLVTCSGIITTAQNNILAECMFLKIPVYAIPMDFYEEQLNAKMISDYFYGMNYPVLEEKKLNEFIQNKSFYIDNIRHSEILFKETGNNKIIQIISSYLNT